MSRVKRVFFAILFCFSLLFNQALIVSATEEVTIGVISSTTTSLDSVETVADLAMEDINNYMAYYGYPYRFNYELRDATGQAAVHLEHVQEFKHRGIDLIVGGRWCSQAQASLSYCNDNNVLLLSPSSTSPLLAIPDDNLFRTSPTDRVQAPAIAEMLWSHGIKAVVVIHRGDAWADGIYNYLEPAYTEKGGVILERIRYAGEATDFRNYLQSAEDVLSEAVAEYGAEHVGVQILSFSEFVTMITQAQDYETLYNLPWFGSDGTVLSQQVLDDASSQASHLKLYSTYATPPNSDKFNDFNNKYIVIMNQFAGFYSTAGYDAYWLIALSVAFSGSSNAIDVKEVLPLVASTHEGASGLCCFNEDGDRADADFQIWSVKGSSGDVYWDVSGQYFSEYKAVEWYAEDDSREDGGEAYYSVSLIHPKLYDMVTSGNVPFQVIIYDTDGNPVQSSAIEFYLDDELIEVVYTNSSGVAETGIQVNEGTHIWRVVGEKIRNSTCRFTAKAPIQTYEIKIESPYGITRGSGTYNEGEPIAFGVGPTTVDLGQNIMMEFKEWESDCSAGYTGTSPVNHIIVTDNITQTAIWEKYYYVEVKYKSGSVSQDSGWYKAGTSLSLEAFPPEDPFISYRFNGWTGSRKESDENTVIVIDSPLTIYASWTPVYTKLYIIGVLITGLITGVLTRKRLAKKTESEKREKFVKYLKSTEDIIKLERAEKEHDLDLDEVKSIINGEMDDGGLAGSYSVDGKCFIKTDYILNKITEKFR